MQQIDLGGTALEYETAGAGDPVVCIHGALIADSFRPLFDETDLTDRYRLIAYRRRGYGASTPADRSVDISQQAADCLGMCDRLGVERAHVVGHSLGGVIALQVALDAPELVQTLTLLEPAMMVGGSAEDYRASLARGRERYRSAGAEAIVEEFFDMRFGGGSRAAIKRAVPGAFEQAVADAGTSFDHELPALLAWDFTAELAAQLSMPSLVVLGEDSPPLSPRFEESYETLLVWLPNAEGCLLPDAAHGMQMQNPRGTAIALASFFARNPLRDSGAHAG